MVARKLSEIAAKAARDPYELDLEDGGEVIAVSHPAIGKWQEALEGNNLDAFLTVLGVGEEDRARVAALMPDQVVGTPGELVADMRVHFGLGN